jgi:hypothetical protein
MDQTPGVRAGEPGAGAQVEFRNDFLSCVVHDSTCRSSQPFKTVIFRKHSDKVQRLSYWSKELGIPWFSIHSIGKTRHECPLNVQLLNLNQSGEVSK